MLVVSAVAVFAAVAGETVAIGVCWDGCWLVLLACSTRSGRGWGRGDWTCFFKLLCCVWRVSICAEGLRMASKRTDVDGSSYIGDSWTSVPSLGPVQFFPGVQNWWLDFGVLHPGHLPFLEDIASKKNSEYLEKTHKCNISKTRGISIVAIKVHTKTCP